MNVKAEDSPAIPVAVVRRQAVLLLVRQNYAGPAEFGEDLMVIDVGDSIVVHH